MEILASVFIDTVIKSGSDVLRAVNPATIIKRMGGVGNIYHVISMSDSLLLTTSGRTHDIDVSAPCGVRYVGKADPISSVVIEHAGLWKNQRVSYVNYTPILDAPKVEITQSVGLLLYVESIEVDIISHKGVLIGEYNASRSLVDGRFAQNADKITHLSFALEDSETLAEGILELQSKVGVKFMNDIYLIIHSPRETVVSYQSLMNFAKNGIVGGKAINNFYYIEKIMSLTGNGDVFVYELAAGLECDLSLEHSIKQAQRRVAARIYDSKR